jgi:uncharacterized FlaG/YvyC family protein
MSLPCADRLESEISQRTYVQFIIDERTGQIKVNFIDGANGHVLKQIPPNQLQGIVADYLASGRVNDQVAQD